tara:strand:- start:21992 stop:22366 length:375 start_codon:yes stop_codon:yes gene_type:complete
MISPETILRTENEAADRAREEGLTPWVPWDEAEIHRVFRGGDGDTVPFIGDRVPEGWELVDTHFVDTSGFGSPGEPALTIDSFIRIAEGGLKNARGWASIHQTGPFQVYIGEFKQDDLEDVEDE